MTRLAEEYIVLVVVKDDDGIIPYTAAVVTASRRLGWIGIRPVRGDCHRI